MGRKAKHATLREYQPYIDIIRADLQIPETAIVQVRFSTFKYKWGDAWFDPNNHFGRVRVDKTLGKHLILEILMHEFRHIQQRVSGVYITKNKKQVLWNNVEYKHYNVMTQYSQYYNSPWEIDARAYEQEVKRLFPHNQLPLISRREYIGSVGKSKYYRVKQ